MTKLQFDKLVEGQLITIKRVASKTVVVFERKWFPTDRNGVVHGGEYLEFKQLGVATFKDVIDAIQRDEERHNKYKERLYAAFRINEENK